MSSTYYALYKKGFDCKKTGFVLRLHTHKKVVLTKTGFTNIKKGFSKIKVNLFFCGSVKKTKERKSFSSNRNIVEKKLQCIERFGGGQGTTVE